MIYRVRHRTTYAYDHWMEFARCVLRLTPASSDVQTVLEHSIAITPQPSQSHQRLGPLGQQTRTIAVDKPHRSLVIEARSRVDVHAAPPADPGCSPAWESVRTRSLETSDLGPRSPASLLYPTPRTPLIPEITDYARTSFAPGRPIAEAAAELMTRMRSDFTYDSKATNVRTTPGEAFAARRGVCQDFAHIMISALRGLGLPAAYVSGYLRTVPPPGRPRLDGADATHAWVSLWCGETGGWIGFDPTNAIFVRDDHITVATGRDYDDVAPIDGVVLGFGDQALKVAVDVIPEDGLRVPGAPPSREPPQPAAALIRPRRNAGPA